MPRTNTSSRPDGLPTAAGPPTRMPPSRNRAEATGETLGEAPPIELRQVKERPRLFSGSPTDVHLGAALIQRFAEVFLEPAA